ncbi:MAG: hypothetical protein GXP08_01265 [Gammaproteobacteria bacterium]|nr:hypothetical protein [Gammaproteobacteria bacterium]
MDSLLKQRIIGACVLISLGIIFIPMFLTGKGDYSSDELKSNIPPLPMYEIRTSQVLSLPSEALLEPLAVPLETAHTQDAKVGLSATLEETNSEESEPDPLKATVSEKIITAEQNTVKRGIVNRTPDKKPQQTLVQKNIVVPEPVVDEGGGAMKEAIVSGWVVQIGSFTVEKNALKLRDKLRKKGHASFVESLSKNNAMLYRVRVGPELTKRLAQDLNKQLGQETQLKGLVMRYPS